MKEKNYNCSLDILKLVATIMIIGSHALPLFHNNTLNYYYGQYLFRFCVPIFFLSSGYFFNKMNKEKRKEYIKRIFIIYILSTFFYLPLILYSSKGFNVIYSFVFGYSHLWYLIALLYALILYYIIKDKKCNNLGIISIVLLLIGIVFGEYYKLLDLKLFNAIHDAMYYIGTSRNALFFALPLLMIGGKIEDNKEKLINKKTITYIIMISIFAIISFVESTILLYKIGSNIHLDETLFNLFVPIVLFILCLKKSISIPYKLAYSIRKMCDYMYIIHVYLIYIIHGFFEIRYLYGYLLIVILSILSSYFIITFQSKLTKRLRINN